VFTVSTPLYQYTYFRYNVITNITTGIYFSAAYLSNHQQLGAAHADYNTISSFYNTVPSPSAQSVSTAIAMDNVINCYTTPSFVCNQFPYIKTTASNNTIQNVYTGIEMSNWINPNAFNTVADSNYILLNQNPTTTATQFGISKKWYIYKV
jgi:hypothetical protein